MSTFSTDSPRTRMSSRRLCRGLFVPCWNHFLGVPRTHAWTAASILSVRAKWYPCRVFSRATEQRITIGGLVRPCRTQPNVQLVRRHVRGTAGPHQTPLNHCVVHLREAMIAGVCSGSAVFLARHTVSWMLGRV